jgi:hypothetical protein
MSYCTRLAICASMLGVLLLDLNSTIQAQTAKTPAEELRVFQSRDGETQYVGTLLKLNGSRVTLQPEEGEAFDLRMSDLSRGDQLWIRNADRAMRLIEKQREQALEMIQDLAEAKSERDLKSLCIKLREFGELAADAQLQLQGLMTNPANGEIAYHAAVTFAVVSPKTPDNWNELLKVLKEGNPQLLLLTQRAPGPMLAGMSLFGQQAFPLLQAAAYTGEISLEPTDWSAAELQKLNTVRGPKNAARASACLAIGEINSDAAISVILGVIKEAAVKLNGMADGATIEACLASIGKLGYSGAAETLDAYEDQFPATVEKSRELIALAQERKKMQQELAKLRATRLFTDRRGNQVRASLENLSDGRVRLKKLDDKLVVVPLEDFSDDDQAWILAKIESMGSRSSESGTNPIPSGIPAGPREPATDEQANLARGIVVIPEGKMRVDEEHPILKGCVGWWPLTDGAGDKAMDVTERGDDLVNAGTAFWSKGEIGNFLSLNRGDDYLFAPLRISGVITYSIWVNIPDDNPQFICDGKELLGRKYICVTNGTVRAGSSVGDSPDSFKNREIATGGIELNCWNHILVVWDSQNSVLYLNGVKGGTGDTGNQPLNGLYVGRQIDKVRMKGSVQNFRIWNRALSEAEVKQLYEEPFIGLKPIEDSEEEMK